MIDFGLRDILLRVFYALQGTKTPMINATIAVNIVLNFILSKYLGIGGLALATSIAAILFSPLIDLEKIHLSAIIQIRGKFHDTSESFSRAQKHSYVSAISRSVQLWAHFQAKRHKKERCSYSIE